MLTGNVTGMVTGHLTGNVTGDLTGNVTATTVTDGTASLTGAVFSDLARVSTTVLTDGTAIMTAGTLTATSITDGTAILTAGTLVVNYIMSSFGTAILPITSGIYDLGSSARPFRAIYANDGYFSSNTIYVGGSAISSGTNGIEISDTLTGVSLSLIHI